MQNYFIKDSSTIVKISIVGYSLVYILAAGGTIVIKYGVDGNDLLRLNDRNRG